MKHALLSCVLAIVPATCAAADGDGAFRLDVTLDAWFPRLVGDVPLGAGGASVDVAALNLHDSEVAFSGAARVTWDRCFVEARGFSFDTDGNTPTLSSSASWWSASIDVGYALWRPFDDRPFPWSESSPRADNRAQDGAQRLSLAIAPTIGFSWDDVDIATTTTATGARAGVAGGWASIRVGAELGLSLHTKDLVGFLESVDVLASVSVGPSFGASGSGDGTGDLWWVDGGVRVMVTSNIGAHLGYRLVDSDFRSAAAGGGEDSLNIGLQGLVAGLSIRF